MTIVRNIYTLLFSLLWLCSYSQSESREIPSSILKFTSDFPNGETFVLNEDEIEKKYSNNFNLYANLKSQFFNSHNSSSEIVKLVQMDLDHIEVFESREMHTITYKVNIGDQELNEDGEPLTVYNLMHFSKDYKTYHFILLRYDFSKIPYKDYIEKPHEATNVLSFIPLNDIGNIYENIVFSFAQELLINADLLSSSAPYYDKIIAFAKCAKAIDVAGVPCKSCGLHFGEVVDGKWCTHKDSKIRPQPKYTFMDLSDCEERLRENDQELVSI